MLNSRLLPATAGRLINGPNTQHFVVLLHAFPLSSTMWDRMADEFEELRDDTTFLLIDLPGFGDSPRQPDWTMQRIALPICQEIRHYTRERVVLGGLSMGGYAAFAFYSEYPNMLRGLVLSNTKADADTESAKHDREIFASDALARGSEAATHRLYSKFVTEETDPEIAIDIRTWMDEAHPEAIADALHAMAARPDSTDLLRLISIPSLVISGSRDEIIPAADMRRVAVRLQDAAYVEIKGAAHLTAAERPKEWAEALGSFLDRIV